MTLKPLLVLFTALSLAVAGGCKKEDAPSGTAGSGTSGSKPAVKLLNASYDPTREMYQAYNPLFAQYWKEKNGQDVQVTMAHGPSGKQARAIAEGLEADIAALSVDFDIDQIAKAGLIPQDWRSRLPNDSVPYFSAVVFMVRKGNPKGIKDWEDLARPDVTALAPDPKTGGGARWIYLATWAHGLRKNNNDEAAARAFTAKVYDDAITDPAMRGSTTRFTTQNTGDVLFGWENEILQVINDPASKGQYEIVVPSDSITIEVPVAWVDKYADKHGTTDVAKAYCQYLFDDAGQDLVAKFYNRPYKPEVQKKYEKEFPPLTLYRFKDYFKDWPTVMKQHFDNGGELDKMRKK
jgi:sulfate transport system substrate-binding protein